MARVNIEECWWHDPRRSRLSGLLGGSVALADGTMIMAWRMAQECWKENRNLIPLEKFEYIENFERIFEAKLAVLTDEGVYLKGTREYLEWNFQRREAAKIGGSKRKQNEPKATKPKQTQPSDSDSDSDSDSVSESESDSDSVSKKSTSIRLREGELHEIAKLWNELAHSSLPRVEKMTGKRTRACKKLSSEKLDMEDLRKAITKINSSSFLRGESERGWKANFDWFLKPENQTRALEGQYDDKGGKDSNQTTIWDYNGDLADQYRTEHANVTKIGAR